MRISRFRFPIQECLLVAMVIFASCLIFTMQTLAKDYSKKAKELTDAIQIAKSASEIYLSSTDAQQLNQLIKDASDNYIVNVTFTTNSKFQQANIEVCNKEGSSLYQLTIDKLGGIIYE